MDFEVLRVPTTRQYEQAHALEGQHTHIRSRSSGGVECCSAAHSIERHTYRSLPFVRYATHSHSYPFVVPSVCLFVVSIKQPYMYVCMCVEGRVKGYLFGLQTDSLVAVQLK
jgi:hypothetical protein